MLCCSNNVITIFYTADLASKHNEDSGSWVMGYGDLGFLKLVFMRSYINWWCVHVMDLKYHLWATLAHWFFRIIYAESSLLSDTTYTTRWDIWFPSTMTNLEYYSLASSHVVVKHSSAGNTFQFYIDSFRLLTWPQPNGLMHMNCLLMR